MSFEERIERLTERHEALAQTVEMHHATLSRIEETQERQQKMAESLLAAIRDEHVIRRDADERLREAHEQAWREMREANQEQRERIDALVNAMEMAFQRTNQHEVRINKLEGNS